MADDTTYYTYIPEARPADPNAEDVGWNTIYGLRSWMPGALANLLTPKTGSGATPYVPGIVPNATNIATFPIDLGVGINDYLKSAGTDATGKLSDYAPSLSPLGAVENIANRVANVAGTSIPQEYLPSSILESGYHAVKDWANKQWQGSLEHGRDVAVTAPVLSSILPPAPQTPGETTARDVAENVGSALFPGGVIAKTGKAVLGSMVGKLLHAVPSTAMAPILGGMTLAQHGLEDIANQLDAQKEGGGQPTGPAALPGAGGPDISMAPVDLSTFTDVNARQAQPDVGMQPIDLSTAPGQEPSTVAPVPNAQTDPSTATHGSIGLGLMAGLGLISLFAHHGSPLLTKGLDALRGRGTQADRTAFANASIDNAQATGEPAQQAVLPGKAGNIGVRTTGAVSDEHALLAATTDALAGTPEGAKTFRGAIGTVFNEAAQQPRLQAIARTGVVPGAGNIAPFQDYLMKYENATPQQQHDYSRSMEALNELENRFIKQKDIVADTGVVPPDADTRFNLAGVSSDDLRQMVQNLRQDPVVNDLVQSHQQQVADWLRVNRDKGNMSASDYADVSKFRKSYVPTTNEKGLVTSPFEYRNVEGQGSPQYSSDVLNGAHSVRDAMLQKFDILFKDMDYNAVKRAVIERGLEVQKADPNASKLFTQVAGDGDQVINYQTEDGPQYVRVNNTALYNAIPKGPALGNRWGDIANKAREWVQKGTTGWLGFLAGKAFQLTTGMPRNMMLVPSLMDKSIHATALSKALGRKIPVTDPLTVLMNLRDAGDNVRAMTMQRLADTLHPDNTNNPINRQLRNAVSDQWVNGLHNWAKAAYADSAWNQMRARSIGGVAHAGGAEMAKSIADPFFWQRMRTTGDAVVPGLRHSGVGRFSVSLKNFIEDLSAAFADAPHTTVFKMNRDRTDLAPLQLEHALRTVIGDPGVHGSNALVKGINAVTPYHNVMIQAASSVARNIRDNPMSFGAGIAGHSAMLAAASIFSAMAAGPNAVRHLMGEVASNQLASGVPIYDPSNPDPAGATWLPVPREFGYMVPYMLSAIGSATNAWNLHQGEPMYHRVMHALGDMFSEHVHMGTTEGMLKGAGGFLDLPQLPPLMQSVINTLGGEVRISAPDMISNALHGQPIMHGMLTKFDQREDLPGAGPHSMRVSDHDSRTIRSLLHGVIGGAGEAVDNALWRAYGYVHGGETIGDTLRGALSDWGQHFKDTNAILNNVVWRNNAQLERDPLTESVQNRMANLRLIQHGLTEGQWAGATRPGGMPLNIGDDRALPDDPTMRRMYLIAGQRKQLIDKALMPRIDDINKQITSVREGQLYADQKRDAINGLMRKRHDYYEAVDHQLHVLNDSLSDIAGGHVDVGKSIDWKGDTSQFHGHWWTPSDILSPQQ